MISGDLNQLLKKIKRHRSLCWPSPVSVARVSFDRAPVSSNLLPPPPSSCLPFCTIMRASHVEKRDYLRHGIENAARASLSDARLPRFWSGFRFDIVPFPLSLSVSFSSSVFLPAIRSRGSLFVSAASRRYPSGTGETVNQRQGRVTGRGIGALGAPGTGAACSCSDRAR